MFNFDGMELFFTYFYFRFNLGPYMVKLSLLIWYRRNLDQGLVGGKVMMKFEEMSKKIK